ncbi:MAG TPA: cupin domain-containing protein [Methylomirabilota bacterium]|nr:cupin domain-containing protein [Methylomirabilota bacterium]
MTNAPLRLIPASGRGEFETAERCHITELLNDPSVGAVSLARARVEPGVTTQLHALDVREIYVVLDGAGEVDSGDGAPALTVGPGDAVEIPAGTAQRIRNTGTTDLVFLCLCLPRFRPEGYTALAD